MPSGSLKNTNRRVPASIGTLEPLDEQSCVLHTTVDWIGGLVTFVADLGLDFEVQDPPELVEGVRRLAVRLAGATPERQA